jgi:hypothetical protein
MLKSAGTAVTYHEPAWRFLGQLLIRQSKIVAGDLRNIPRYVLHALLGVAAVCGLMSLWGSHGDGKMPGMSSLSGLDPYRISSAHCIADETTAEARWRGLSPALAILNNVNPAVAKWVREKHDSGLLLFANECQTPADPTSASAKYDILRGRIVVRRDLFHENDGTIAAILCHEYRHSRQNLGKFCQYVLSFLFVREGDLSIIENDAALYEQEAHNAIFGNGRSREKELAAWEHAVQLQNQDRSHGCMSPPCIAVVASESHLP